MSEKIEHPAFQETYFIPFPLADPAGVVFFGHVFILAHQAFEQFIISKICSWQEWFQHPEWIIPIKQTEATYYSPLFAGQECSLSLQIEQLSNSTFTVAYLFEQNKPCCLVKTVHVFCDRLTKEKIAIPTKIREPLALIMPLIA